MLAENYWYPEQGLGNTTLATKISYRFIGGMLQIRASRPSRLSSNDISSEPLSVSGNPFTLLFFFL